MKFYQGLLSRIIWDPSKGKPMADFGVEGTFETDDEDLIKLLRGKGYLVYSDLEILEATGRLPHGGFEKEAIDNHLPSGRPPVEDDKNIHGTKGQIPGVRPREEEPIVDVDDLQTEGSEAAPRRRIKRRNK